MKVYLDNAASSRLRPEVLETMLPYLSNTFGNPSSTHSFGRTSKAAIELARKTIAKHIGASPSEIYFCSSGTEANNLALKLAVENLGVERIITSKIEHKCVLNTCKYLNQFHNIELEYVNLDSLGEADLIDLENKLKTSSKKTLVSLMHVQNELGTINDLKKIALICKNNQAIFHSDTVQSIGHLLINVKEQPVDFLVASAHKFNGPLGAGFLYKKNGLNIGTWLHGGGHEKNLRSSTENVAGIVGMAKAIDLAYLNLDKDQAHVSSLKTYFKQELAANFNNISFNEAKNGVYTILSVTIPSTMANDTLMIKLDMAGIAVSGGSACASGALKVSPVLEALNFDKESATLRFSFAYFNTKEEVDYVLNFFKKL